MTANSNSHSIENPGNSADIKETALLDLEKQLNHSDSARRLEALSKLWGLIAGGEIEKPVTGKDVNNHIHTIYSFSPYSPAAALWMAYKSGLETAGIMDHDSICGAREFIRAGEIIGMSTTIGVECRTDFSNTIFKDRRINNPDQKSIAYVAIHGVPHSSIDSINNFFKPYLEERNSRNKKMLDRINSIFVSFDIELDFTKHVIPLSKSDEGGSITERHLLFALSGKIMEKIKPGKEVVAFLKETLNLKLPSKITSMLEDTDNPYYKYDLLGALKSDLVSMFYIDAKEECPDISLVSKLAKDTGSILAYAYLGDVGDSITGDKKTQKFEDDYIEELFRELPKLGFNAVTYMPSRNTREQLVRVKKLCDLHGLFQISGEDINSPRQKFVCEAMKSDEFKNLYISTWALIGHEKEASRNIKTGMFSDSIIKKYPLLEERINYFAGIAR